MISLQSVCAAVPGLTEEDLLRWLEQDWVRPERRAGEPAFREIDVARIRLIRELHMDFEVDEPTVPLVLSLLDQLYATRRQLRLVLETLDPPARQTVVETLAPVIPLDPEA
jgi:chaperone modulatory protein CbpM